MSLQGRSEGLSITHGSVADLPVLLFSTLAELSDWLKEQWQHCRDFPTRNPRYWNVEKAGGIEIRKENPRYVHARCTLANTTTRRALTWLLSNGYNVKVDLQEGGEHDWPKAEMRLLSLLAAVKETSSRAGQTDKKADNSKKNTAKLPRNQAVILLAQKINREAGSGRTQEDIALEFTESDAKKAKNLLRQLRRFPALLN